MNCCNQRILYLLVLFALAGVCILLTGVSALPDTNQPSINPQTNQLYTAQELKENYNRLLLASTGFKCIVLGSILVVSSLSILGIGYVLRRKCSPNSIVHPLPSSFPQDSILEVTSVEPIVKSATGSAAKAADESVPISPLLKHLPSTTHGQPPTVVPKHPETWNELKLEHLQGRTTSI